VVREVFEKSGFAKLFAIYPDVQSAAGGAPGAAAPPPRSVSSDAAKLLGAGSSSSAPARPTAQAKAAKGNWFSKLLAMIGLGKK